MLMLIILILKNQKFQVYIPSKNVNKKNPFKFFITCNRLTKHALNGIEKHSKYLETHRSLLLSSRKRYVFLLIRLIKIYKYY